MRALLSVRHVCKRLGAHDAVDDVSLDVMTGEAVAILGPSGGGKTTLLRLVAGLETPSSGEVWIGDVCASSAGRIIVAPHEREIGFVFQDLALWPHLTVEKQLDFVLGSSGLSRAERAQRIRDTLALVRIGHLGARHPHELSGGEQQRLALARALAANPRLVLLDEPFSSLDPELRAHLRAELARLQSTRKLTTLYVTHDHDDAAALADRILELRSGHVVSMRNNVREPMVAGLESGPDE